MQEKSNFGGCDARIFSSISKAVQKYGEPNPTQKKSARLFRKSDFYTCYIDGTIASVNNNKRPKSKFKFSFNALNSLTLETLGESRENGIST